MPGQHQGLVKGVILCFRNLYFYFRHGESMSTASQLTTPASQKSKDSNKVPLLLQDLAFNKVSWGYAIKGDIECFDSLVVNNITIYWFKCSIFASWWTDTNDNI